MAETVKVWDAHGCEMSLEEVHSWNSWSKCREDRRFPKGLVEFLEHKEGCAFPAPTNVQAYSWPVLIQGQDLISIAKTGSGKTLAFLLPGFMWLKKNKKSTSPVDCNVGPAILVMDANAGALFPDFFRRAKVWRACSDLCRLRVWWCSQEGSGVEAEGGARDTHRHSWSSQRLHQQWRGLP